MSESNTQTIDEKKNKTSDAPNVDIKPGQFGQFMWQFVVFCLWLIAFWILGSCVLFQCKVAQSNILPTDVNAFPYTDTEPVFDYTKDDHDLDKTIKKNYVNIFKFFEGGKEQNMKLFFDYYLQNDKNKFINQDLYLNGRASRIDPKTGWFGMYTTSLFQGVTSFCFSRYSQVFQIMNALLNERAMLILGPFIMACAFFMITGLNFIYLFWLYFKNMSWFFMDKVDTPSNDEGEGVDDNDDLLDFRKPVDDTVASGKPVESSGNATINKQDETGLLDFSKNVDDTVASGKSVESSGNKQDEKINDVKRGGAEDSPDTDKKRAKWKQTYGFNGFLCVFVNLLGLYGLYPVIFGILSFYTSLSCWVTTLMYSCKIKDDESNETIGFGSILTKNLLYQIPTFAILFMLWLPQASWKTLGPYGLVCSIIVILMLLFGALFYKSDDKTSKEQSYNLKDIFKTITQHPISPDSNYDPITRTYEDKEWNAAGFSAGQPWSEWFIETWNYLNGKKATVKKETGEKAGDVKKATGEKSSDDVNIAIKTPNGDMIITTLNEINNLNENQLKAIKEEYMRKLEEIPNKDGEIYKIRRKDYNSIITAAKGALTKFDKTGSGEQEIVVPASGNVVPPPSAPPLQNSQRQQGTSSEKGTDGDGIITNYKLGGGGSVKDFDRAVRRLKRVLKGI